MSIYLAVYDKRRGWRVQREAASAGDSRHDICGAVNEQVARETAAILTELRRGRN